MELPFVMETLLGSSERAQSATSRARGEHKLGMCGPRNPDPVPIPVSLVPRFKFHPGE